jgi:flavin reductase (DIM6/NTAB) family NADH-FMN oxidoreductase RutF
MTIHPGHPFAEPEPQRDPVRRFRGRLGGAVTLWTSGGTSGGTSGPDPARAGLTVSSVLVALGEPAHVLGLVDPDSDLAQRVAETGTATVQLLAWEHRDLADAFAGVAPAPGGPFRTGSWTQTEWGPVLEGVTAWAGIRVRGSDAEVGWSLLLDGEVEHVEVEPDAADRPLLSRRGRYLRP